MAFLAPLLAWLDRKFPFVDDHLRQGAAHDALVDYLLNQLRREGFRDDIDRISARFGLDPAHLAEVVKCGRVLMRLLPAGECADQPCWVMAARDRNDTPEAPPRPPPRPGPPNSRPR